MQARTAEARPAAPVETLSPEERGRRSHEVMTGMANDLAVTPEFTAALTQAFFARQYSRHRSRNEINQVYFQRGGSGYLVDMHSSRYHEAGSPEKPEGTDMVRSTLEITKYDPTEEIEGWRKKVASVRVSTDIIEGKDGETLGFKNGNVSLDEDYELEFAWDHTWRTAEPQNKSEGSGAIEKLPTVFADLKPTPVKI